MTTEQLESTVSMVTKSENPFLVLFTFSFVGMVVLIIWLARYFGKMNQQNQDIIKRSDEKMSEHLSAYRAELKETRMEHRNSEKNLLKGLQANTDKLETISNTLESVQREFIKLENKVTHRMEDMDNELKKVKSSMSQKEDHKR